MEPDNITMVKLTQSFDDRHIQNVEAETEAQIRETGLSLKKGAKIGVAVGSRGINNLAQIVKATVKTLKDMEAEPFIIPAMGSHGGATAEGQREVLEGYGITEDYVGAPIVSSMEVVRIQAPEMDVPVYMDKQAWNSDGVVLINRIKAHTDYQGHPESGLMKMVVIGLGKHAQALAIHSLGITGLKERIAPVARILFNTEKIVMGIGLVENAYDETMIIEAMKTENIEEREKELLTISRENMPSLPLNDIDVLIVDEMGKDMSGVGIDTNIIGRRRVLGQTEPKEPRIKSIVVDDLTPASHGNAVGVGLSDVCTRKLFDKINFQATYENIYTSSFLDRGHIPIIAENGREAYTFAIRQAALPAGTEPSIVRIKNTLTLGTVFVSTNVAEKLRGKPGITVTEETAQLFEDGEFNKTW
jgi:hypothetical protein